MLQTGELINGIYEVISVIDKGGMSVVYLAMNRRANKQWAIKEVRKTGDKKLDVVRQNLIVEIDMLKKLNHPNLPSIIDVIDRDDSFLIVMDYIQGKSLQKILKSDGAQSQESVVRWGMQICDVLQYLHSQNPPIIYRDMKPANVMLKPDGNITVIDFGTAREFKMESTEDTTCLGTKGYAAPEQYRGNKHHQTDERTDIYNLGVTLYHLLTNKHPNEPPYVLKPITEWNSNLSTGLEKIIIKCTKEDPAERYQSCAELMYDLQHYKDSDVKNLKKSKMRLGAFAAALLLSITSGITSVASYNKYEDSIIADYNSEVEKIQFASTDEEKLLYCLSAISIDPANKTAYEEMIDVFIRKKDAETEPVLTKIEDDIINSFFLGNTDSVIAELQDIVAENGKSFEYAGLSYKSVNPLDSLKQNPQDYAQFCYDMGIAYWYYNETDTSKKSGALKWFRQAKEFAEPDSETTRKSVLYEAIGEFYINIDDLSYRDEDKGEYAKYWELLKSLNNEFEEGSKSKLYEEILTNISVYASNLKSDEITYSDIAGVIEEIKQSSDFTDRTESLISEAIRKINTVYYNTDSSEISDIPEVDAASEENADGGEVE